MASALLTLQQYLQNEHEPDCEYVDGVIEERNAGKRKHSRTQGLLVSRLQEMARANGYDVLVEQRVQVSSSRVRIPDVCLVATDVTDEVVSSPPALWIEILSPEDRWTRIQVKIDDCLQFGVKTLWIIDPYTRQAWIAKPGQQLTELLDGRLRCDLPPVELELDQVLPDV